MAKVKKKVVSADAPVVVRLPKKIIAALDSAAVKNCRSRSSEVRNRLLTSLAGEVRA